MASVASQMIEKVTAHVQSDSLEDALEICADGTYFPNRLYIRPNKCLDVLRCLSEFRNMFVRVNQN